MIGSVMLKSVSTWSICLLALSAGEGNFVLISFEWFLLSCGMPRLCDCSVLAKCCCSGCGYCCVEL